MDDDISAGIEKRIAGLCLVPILTLAAVAVLAERQLAGQQQQLFVVVAVVGALLTVLACTLVIRSIRSSVADFNQRSEILARRELAPTRWQTATVNDTRSSEVLGATHDSSVIGIDRGASGGGVSLHEADHVDPANEMSPSHHTDAADGTWPDQGHQPTVPTLSESSGQDRPPTAVGGHRTQAFATQRPVQDTAQNTVQNTAQNPVQHAGSGAPDAVDPAASVVRNLVKRIQSMLDRQIDLVDELESKEEDPLYLERLFKIDHLANRMRRTADGLLVLAGADLDRRMNGPVPILDVLRVSIGEVEDHRRVASARAESVSVAAGSALPLAHMAAELIENAIEFSPPTAEVEVVGRHSDDGGSVAYEVLVIDQGIGMSDAQLSEMNALLVAPRNLTTLPGHAMGMSVVGHLARRLGASVSLSSNTAGGVTASVQLPLSALDGTDRTPAESSERQAMFETQGQEASPTEPPPLPPSRPTTGDVGVQADTTSSLPPLSPFQGRVSGGPTGTDQPSDADDALAAGLPTLDRQQQLPDEVPLPVGVSQHVGYAEHRQHPSRPSHREPGEIESMLRRYREGRNGVAPGSQQREGEHQ